MTTAPAFLFDLDGTLADTLPDLTASANYVRGLYGLAPVTQATVRTFIGDGARALVCRALDEQASEQGVLDDAVVAYINHHEDQCTRECRLFEGVEPFVRRLREQGHPIAIVTNKPERFARPVVAHLGLDAFTSVVVGGDTLATKKPDPEMLRHALGRLGVTAAGATMIGDGTQDLRAGKALGVRTVACLFGYGDPAALRDEGADAYWSAFGVDC